jgi:hypothetical protein
MIIWLGGFIFCLGIILGIFLTLGFFIIKQKKLTANMNRHERRKMGVQLGKRK